MTRNPAPHRAGARVDARRAGARGGMIACPVTRSRTSGTHTPDMAPNSAKGRRGVLTPAPALDAIFVGAPPSADEWRDIARVLANLVQQIEGPISRGAATRERVLRMTLDGLRRGGPPQ